MFSGSEAGSCLRLIDVCITQIKAQGPSGTCNESEEEVEKKYQHPTPNPKRGVVVWWISSPDAASHTYRGASLIRNCFLLTGYGVRLPRSPRLQGYLARKKLLPPRTMQ